MNIVWSGASPDKFSFNFPIMKSEQLDDGRLMIEGIATSEALDHAGEIVDYESAKAAFSDWKGNIREQHDPKKAVGKAVEVICDDSAKQIILKAFISKGAPETQEKIKDGTLAGFSIGGSVGTRKSEKVSKADGSTFDATRLFVKRISETSVVDAGCNPETAIAIVKADGDSLLGVGLGDGEPSPAPTAIDQLAELLNKGDITPEALLELAKAGKPAAEPEPITKSMYSVQDFASVIASLGWICQSAQDEADWEGDGSPIPAQLRAWFAQGVQIFKDMAAEETAELLASLKQQAGDVDVIEMAQRGHDMAKAGAKFSKDAKDKLAKAHQAVKDAADHLASTGYDKDSSDDSQDDTGKAAGNEDLAKVSGELDLAKADLAKMVIERDSLQKRVTELEALPAPGKALIKAVGKAQDIGESLAEDADGVTKVAPVVDGKGQENEAASLIKMIHQQGGVRAI